MRVRVERLVGCSSDAGATTGRLIAWVLPSESGAFRRRCAHTRLRTPSPQGSRFRRALFAAENRMECGHQRNDLLACQRIQHRLAHAPARDDRFPAQHRQMLGNARLAQADSPFQLAHATLALRDLTENDEPGGIRHGFEQARNPARVALQFSQRSDIARRQRPDSGLIHFHIRVTRTVHPVRGRIQRSHRLPSSRASWPSSVTRQEIYQKILI